MDVAPSAAVPLSDSDVLSANRLGMSQTIANRMRTIPATMLNVRPLMPAGAAVAAGAAAEIDDFERARGAGVVVAMSGLLAGCRAVDELSDDRDGDDDDEQEDRRRG